MLGMKYLVNIAVVDSRGSSVAGRGVVIGSDCGGSSGVGGEGSRSVGSDRGSIGGGWGSRVSSDRGGGGSNNRSGGISSNRSGDKGGGVTTSSSSGLGGDGVGGKGLAVALSVAVSEVSSDPLGVGAAVAVLSAALGAGGAASRPLEGLHWGPERILFTVPYFLEVDVFFSPEGGGSTASLTVTGSKEARLAASCGAQQQNSLKS